MYYCRPAKTYKSNPKSNPRGTSHVTQTFFSEHGIFQTRPIRRTPHNGGPVLRVPPKLAGGAWEPVRPRSAGKNFMVKSKQDGDSCDTVRILRPSKSVSFKTGSSKTVKRQRKTSLDVPVKSRSLNSNGEFSSQPHVSSLSDLSTHPAEEAEWYKLDLDSDLSPWSPQRSELSPQSSQQLKQKSPISPSDFAQSSGEADEVNSQDGEKYIFFRDSSSSSGEEIPSPDHVAACPVSVPVRPDPVQVCPDLVQVCPDLVQSCPDRSSHYLRDLYIVDPHPSWDQDASILIRPQSSKRPLTPQVTHPSMASNNRPMPAISPLSDKNETPKPQVVYSSMIRAPKLKRTDEIAELNLPLTPQATHLPVSQGPKLEPVLSPVVDDETSKPQVINLPTTRGSRTKLVDEEAEINLPLTPQVDDLPTTRPSKLKLALSPVADEIDLPLTPQVADLLKTRPPKLKLPLSPVADEDKADEIDLPLTPQVADLPKTRPPKLKPPLSPVADEDEADEIDLPLTPQVADLLKTRPPKLKLPLSPVADEDKADLPLTPQVADLPKTRAPKLKPALSPVADEDEADEIDLPLTPQVADLPKTRPPKLKPALSPVADEDEADEIDLPLTPQVAELPKSRPPKLKPALTLVADEDEADEIDLPLTFEMTDFEPPKPPVTDVKGERAEFNLPLTPQVTHLPNTRLPKFKPALSPVQDKPAELNLTSSDVNLAQYPPSQYETQPPSSPYSFFLDEAFAKDLEEADSSVSPQRCHHRMPSEIATTGMDASPGSLQITPISSDEYENCNTRAKLESTSGNISQVDFKYSRIGMGMPLSPLRVSKLPPGEYVDEVHAQISPYAVSVIKSPKCKSEPISGMKPVYKVPLSSGRFHSAAAEHYDLLEKKTLPNLDLLAPRSHDLSPNLDLLAPRSSHDLSPNPDLLAPRSHDLSPNLDLLAPRSRDLLEKKASPGLQSHDLMEKKTSPSLFAPRSYDLPEKKTPPNLVPPKSHDFPDGRVFPLTPAVSSVPPEMKFFHLPGHSTNRSHNLQIREIGCLSATPIPRQHMQSPSYPYFMSPSPSKSSFSLCSATSAYSAGVSSWVDGAPSGSGRRASGFGGISSSRSDICSGGRPWARAQFRPNSQRNHYQHHRRRFPSLIHSAQLLLNLLDGPSRFCITVCVCVCVCVRERERERERASCLLAKIEVHQSPM